MVVKDTEKGVVMPGRRCNPCKRLVILLMTGLLTVPLSLPALAAEGAGAACTGEGYRAFDFWVGTWRVALADGRHAGRNEVRLEQQGCVLVERWQGAGGSTGMSMNFFDPVAAQWRQVWVSPRTRIDIRGGRSGDDMILEGTITYPDDGRTLPFRGTWTALPDGRVRQYFEEARSPGTWTPWFEGFYTREVPAP